MPTDAEQPSNPATLLLEDGQAPVVSLHGEIDLSSVAAVQQVIGESWSHGQAHASLVIDLSDVTFFDSSGLGLLVRANDEGGTRGVQVVLRRPSAAASRILELAGTTDWFQIES